MPGKTNVALFILENKVIMMFLQVVFCKKAVCIGAAPTHPQASYRVWIYPLIYVFMRVLFNFGIAMSI